MSRHQSKVSCLSADCASEHAVSIVRSARMDCCTQICTYIDCSLIMMCRFHAHIHSHSRVAYIH